MVAELELGVDISSYGGIPSQSTIDCWKANGVKYVIVQYSELLPQILAKLDGQGFELSIYIFLYFPISEWNQFPIDRVKAALDMTRGHDIKYVFLDLEDGSFRAGWNASNTVSALLQCSDYIESRSLYKAGIYTGKFTWNEHTNSSDALRHLPLMHADYTSEAPNIDMSKKPTALAFRNGPYGGWTLPAIWQWHNTTIFCGHSVDANVREMEQEEMYNAEVVWSNFFAQNNGLQIGENESQEINARVDFGWPANTLYGHAKFYVKSGSFEIYQGRGDNAKFLVEIGRKRSGYYDEVATIVTDSEGWITLKAKSDVEFEGARGLGYWT